MTYSGSSRNPLKNKECSLENEVLKKKLNKEEVKWFGHLCSKHKGQEDLRESKRGNENSHATDENTLQMFNIQQPPAKYIHKKHIESGNESPMDDKYKGME